jgi:methylphosphotriester-DNA--protein-cysteine methyltransferase
MVLRARHPGPPLATFVDVVWVYEGPPLPHARERLMPDGSVELVVALRDEVVAVFDRRNLAEPLRFPAAVVCGPHSEYFVIDTTTETFVAGVHFRPGGSYPFFAAASGEVRNQHVALEDLWGVRATRRLREQLLEAPSHEARLDVLERCLIEQARRPLARPPEIAYALREFARVPHVRTVRQVTDQVGLTAKRFIQTFDQTVGLTPKVFCRVRRFQHVLHRIHTAQDVDWVGIALDAGYYDQSHFIHDFQAFSGLTPSDYLARRTPHLNHVPMEI